MKKRGYSAAANVARYGDFKASRGSADYELRDSLAEVRAKTRFLARNSGSMKRFMQLMRINVVGENGIRFQSRVKRGDGALNISLNAAVEMAWSEWCDAPTVCGTQHMIDVQRQALDTWCRDGEVIWEMVLGPSYTHGIAINPIEADQLDETLNTIFPQTNNEIRMGVEINRQGRPVAYHFLTTHPGDVVWLLPQTDKRYRRVPAERVIHIYDKSRPGQTRGEPPASAMVLDVKMIDGNREAETMGRRLRAALSGFFEKEMPTTAGIDELADGEGGSADEEEMLEMSIDPGTLKELPPGIKFSEFSPGGSTTDYKDFEMQVKKNVAMGVGISTMSHGMEVEGVSYSSGRTITIEDRDFYKEMQGFIIRKAMVPLFRMWARMSVLYHDAYLPTQRPRVVMGGKFRGRGWDWVDPSKDVEANRKALATGQTSLARVAAQRGIDRDELLNEIVEDQEAMRARGLTPNYTDDSSAAEVTSEDDDDA